MPGSNPTPTVEEILIEKYERLYDLCKELVAEMEELKSTGRHLNLEMQQAIDDQQKIAHLVNKMRLK